MDSFKSLLTGHSNIDQSNIDHLTFDLITRKNHSVPFHIHLFGLHLSRLAYMQNAHTAHV